MQCIKELDVIESINFILRRVQPLRNQCIKNGAGKGGINIDLFVAPYFSQRYFGSGMRVRFEMDGTNSVSVDYCFPNTILGLVAETRNNTSTFANLTGGLGSCKIIVSGNVLDKDKSYGDIDLLIIHFDLAEGNDHSPSYVEIPLLALSAEIFEFKNYLDIEEVFPQVENGPTFDRFLRALKRCIPNGNNWDNFSLVKPLPPPVLTIV